MPLKSGGSQKTISSNIAELHHANKDKSKGKKRSEAQMAAIAYSQARKTKKKGQSVPMKKSEEMHKELTNLIKSQAEYNVTLEKHMALSTAGVSLTVPGFKRVGTTGSGKDIYADIDNPQHQTFTEQDHLDAAAVHEKQTRTENAKEKAYHSGMATKHKAAAKKKKDKVPQESEYNDLKDYGIKPQLKDKK